MNIEEIAKRIAELHYPNKPNAIIDEPYRLVRMKTLRQQIESELKNCYIPVVSKAEGEPLIALVDWLKDKKHLLDSNTATDIVEYFRAINGC